MRQPYYTLDTLQASNSVGFLMKRCGVLMSQLAEQRFAALSISFTQWLALHWLATQQRRVSATRLSEELGHDMGALTRVVDQLERLGFVRRERSRRDRRAVEIAITPAGRRQARSAKRVLLELLNQLVAPFSEREIDTLIVLLQRLMQHLQAAAGVEAAVPPAASLHRAPSRSKRRRPATGAA
ncbi:MAG TPA: MarR family transcriptional regulator [Steroidobacteraceae bacterium]|nr:MarR family transcriptional regulator [Steroidobacteraceae bacterium]